MAALEHSDSFTEQSMTTSAATPFFRARALGCECSVCPLGPSAEHPGTPVHSEMRQGARLYVIGEAPGADEVKQGAPFVGLSGKLLMETLKQHGVARADVSLSNAMLCRPPVEFKAFTKSLGFRNRKRKKMGKPEWPSPIACCRPRVLGELAMSSAVLTVGATGYASVTGASADESGMMSMRGFPHFVNGTTPIVATVHPAFVLRARSWSETFLRDCAKALRHAAGRLNWQDPEMVLDPSVEELRAALARLEAQVVAVDTETDGLDPETCNLRCVGLSSQSFGVAVGFQSVETPAREWRCPPEQSREMLAAFFSRCGTENGPKRILVHNQVYDQPVLRRHGMPLPDVAKVVDTIMLHKSADSEMPHDLDFLASFYTDAPKWKPTHGHDAWESDSKLHRYCLLDCSVTARLAPVLRDAMIQSNQLQVFAGDLELQRLAIGMHRAGIAVDRNEQQRHADRLEALMLEATARAASATEGTTPSLGSADQVRDYLYQRRKIFPPDVYTPLGEASVNKDALYELLRRGLPEHDRAFIEALLDYRRSQKALTAFVTNLEVGADGRIHATWNAHSVRSGRLSCSGPNLQTIPSTKQDPDSLRSMFTAAPGCMLVGADYDQLHMRIIAVRAPIPAWLETFAKADRGDTGPEADIHTVNAALFYDKPPAAVQKFERSCVKTLSYASIYGAGPLTILQQMVRVRDPATGVRPYARMILGEARALRSKFLRTYPELPRWWDREVREWRAGGESRSMLFGRLLRLKDLQGGFSFDGEDSGLSDIANAPILLTEGDIAGGNGASYRAMRQIGWPWFGDGQGMGGAGLIMHIHDALYCEVSSDRVNEAKEALRASMETSLSWNGNEVRITAKPKAGVRWSELG